MAFRKILQIFTGQIARLLLVADYSKAAVSKQVEFSPDQGPILCSRAAIFAELFKYITTTTTRQN